MAAMSTLTIDTDITDVVNVIFESAGYPIGEMIVTINADEAIQIKIGGITVTYDLPEDAADNLTEDDLAEKVVIYEPDDFTNPSMVRDSLINLLENEFDVDPDVFVETPDIHLVNVLVDDSTLKHFASIVVEIFDLDDEDAFESYWTMPLDSLVTHLVDIMEGRA